MLCFRCVRLPRKAHRSSVCKNSFAHGIFVRRKIRLIFVWRNPVPAPPPEGVAGHDPDWSGPVDEPDTSPATTPPADDGLVADALPPDDDRPAAGGSSGEVPDRPLA